MARRQREKEESVYDWGRLGSAPAVGAAAPKVQTYNVPAPAAAPKVKMHVDSSQVESILNPVRGIRDAQARAGITPTDHSRHNILAIKEQSRLNALQKQQQEEQAQQHLRPQMRRTTSGSAGGAGPGGINRSLSGGGRAAAAGAGRPVIVRSVSGNAAAGGRSASGGGSSDGRDFVQENKAAAAAASRPVKAESRQDSGAAYLQKSEYGQVPGYLLQRKVEMAQQEAAMQAAKQAAQIPAGLRQMPEAERLATLQLLDANKAEVEARLSALPIIIETPSAIRHKDELERRLREIEDARRIFSRPNVLVHAGQQQ
uniref:Enkurin domain-containing protein n=1 Tax=Tetradesmus obliquus TaxID=3088 RepID=A0A383VWF5_TETOB|eukprot:jgi/Sobl393_1/3115/SZX69179.1